MLKYRRKGMIDIEKQGKLTFWRERYGLLMLRKRWCIQVDNHTSYYYRPSDFVIDLFTKIDLKELSLGERLFLHEYLDIYLR